MQTCSKCGKNREDVDLIGDVCHFCIEDEKKVKNSSGFWRHAFSLKYYILPLFAGVFYVLYNMKTGTDFDKDFYEPIKIMNMIIGVIAAYQYKVKKTFFNKVGLYIVVVLIANFVSFATIIGGNILTLNSPDNNKFISNIIESSEKNLPLQLNDEALYLKITSDSPNSIVGHIKYVNYTSADLLEGLTTKEFEEELLKQELEVSCKDSGVQLLIKKGIIHHIKYYDKDDIAFAQISITNEQCKPYY